MSGVMVVMEQNDGNCNRSTLQALLLALRCDCYFCEPGIGGRIARAATFFLGRCVVLRLDCM